MVQIFMKNSARIFHHYIVNIGVYIKYHRRCYQAFTNSKRKVGKHVERPKKSLRLFVGSKQNERISTNSLVNGNRNKR